jgi:triphosphoribosyl-dephospho-CoA synthetase
MSFLRVRLRLLSALRELARPATAQLSHLRRRGLEDSVDELRLHYEEAMAGAAPFMGQEVSSAQAERLRVLTTRLHTMATRDQTHLWSERALRLAPEWADVRELAAAALMEFDAWPRNWGKGRRRAIRASADAARKLKSS